MSARELVVLGTASQVPTRYRNHNGYFLRWDGEGILFDPGEGTQRQMTIAGVPASAITRICVTHFHGDHCLGLAGVIQRISLDEVEHEVSVHYPRSGERFFRRLRHASIFRDRSRLRPEPIAEEGVIFEGEDFRMLARRLDHGVDAWGFRLQEEDKRRMLPERLRALGVRGPDIGRLVREGQIPHAGRTLRVEEVSEPKPGQSVAFIMDTRPCEGARRLAEGADLLVCESTYLHQERKLARQAGHMTAKQTATLAKEAGARKLVLTHFSQRHADERVYLAEAQPIFGETVAARDGLVVEVPKRR